MQSHRVCARASSLLHKDEFHNYGRGPIKANVFRHSIAGDLILPSVTVQTRKPKQAPTALDAIDSKQSIDECEHDRCYIPLQPTPYLEDQAFLPRIATSEVQGFSPLMNMLNYHIRRLNSIPKHALHSACVVGTHLCQPGCSAFHSVQGICTALSVPLQDIEQYLVCFRPYSLP